MAVKSSATLLAELRAFLRAYNKSLDTGDTSLSKDLILTPYSIAGKAVMDQVEIARNLHLTSKQTGTSLDDEATNCKLERSGGTYSTVRLTFWTDTEPVADIMIPAGTQAQTAGTAFVSSVIFSTISDASFPAASAAAYYSYDRARYEFAVDAQCNEIGSNGNIGAGLINIILNPIDNIRGVTNLDASSGGDDQEDDDDLRTRIQKADSGRDLNVPNGVRNFTVTEGGFRDAYPVRVEDSDSERAWGIDVFVIAPYTKSITETFIYYPNTPRFYLSNSPVREVTSVIASTGPVLSTNYDVNVDNTTPLRRSQYAEDYVEIRNSASIPSGTQVDITYTYVEDIRTMQQAFTNDNNEVLTAAVIVKRAFPVSLYINANLTLTLNADGPSTRTRCRNALIQFMDTYRLNDSIQKSDLILVLQQGYGDFPVDTVDAVIVNSYYVRDEFGNITLPIDEVISVGKKYYAVFGNAVLL
jgi:hypothetical protein